VSGAPKLTNRNLEGSLPAAGALIGDFAAQHRQDQRAALMQVQGDVKSRLAILDAKESERAAGYTDLVRRWQETLCEPTATSRTAAGFQSLGEIIRGRSRADRHAFVSRWAEAYQTGRGTCPAQRWQSRRS
jgi:hypothetical protein